MDDRFRLFRVAATTLHTIDAITVSRTFCNYISHGVKSYRGMWAVAQDESAVKHAACDSDRLGTFSGGQWSPGKFSCPSDKNTCIL